MADKAISELVAAEQIKSTDMFVLEQDGTAKRLQGQTLLNWLTAAADGHGGISNIAKTGTDGLVDTYTITLADTTTKTFTVTNGNGLTNFEKLSTVGLVDNYRFTRTDGTFFDFSVYNGAKGDKGEDSHVWIKYASQQPTANSHSMGDLPDAWMGVYSGTAAEAPDDWQQYTWYQIKGEKGDTGAAATVTGTTVEYMVSDSGTIVPSGSWSTTIPTVPQGKYLWTKVTTTFNTGSPAVSYSVTRMGIDGAGSVSSVNEKSPDESGNVSLSAEDIPTSGGRSVQAVLDDKQEALTAGENISISGSVIATKAFPCNPKILDNWYWGNPVNQRGQTSYTGTDFATYSIDRWLCHGSMHLSNGEIEVSREGSPYGYGYFLQKLGCSIDGKTVTASVLTSDGVLRWGTLVATSEEQIVPGTDDGLSALKVSSSSFKFSIGSTDNVYKIIAVGLELGSQQTLAHQENGVWGLNEIPDYGEQLRRCQRYLRPAGYNFVVSAVNGNWYASNLFGRSEPMRAAPAIVNGDYKAQPIRDVTGGQCATITNVFAVTIYGQFTIQLSPLGSTIPNYVYIDASGFNPLLSAEL
jgi:hypothetical protein|nr:MAG TPA: tail protein [Caudoviricetes sp.]